MVCCPRQVLQQTLYNTGDDKRHQGGKKLQDGIGGVLQCWRRLKLQPTLLSALCEYGIGRFGGHRHCLVVFVEIGLGQGKLNSRQEISAEW